MARQIIGGGNPFVILLVGEANFNQSQVGIVGGQFCANPRQILPDIPRLLELEGRGNFGGRGDLADIIEGKYLPFLRREAANRLRIEGQIVIQDGELGDRSIGGNTGLVLLSPAVLKWHHLVHDGATISDVA